MTDNSEEKYWNRFQDTYDENQEYVVGKELLDEVKRKIMKLNNLGEILELGCGTGYFTTSLFKISDHITATDISPELLEKARQRLGNTKKTTFLKKNCYSTSFESGKFDAVFMANLIHVVADPTRVLQECFRVLRNDGLLIITTFTNYSMNALEIIKMGIRYIKVWGRPPRYTHRFSPDNLGSLIKSTGFSLEESEVLGAKTRSLFIIGKKINN